MNAHRKWISRSVAAPAALAWALAAAGADLIRLDRQTTAGKEVLIRGFAEFDANCKLVKAQSITVATKPANGNVETRPGEVVVGPNWVGAVNCEGTRLNGVKVFYVPRPGFTGTDAFAFDVAYAKGRVVRAEISVKVEK